MFEIRGRLDGKTVGKKAKAAKLATFGTDKYIRHPQSALSVDNEKRSPRMLYSVLEKIDHRRSLGHKIVTKKSRLC